jgi:hypothetical protein
MQSASNDLIQSVEYFFRFTTAVTIETTFISIYLPNEFECDINFLLNMIVFCL